MNCSRRETREAKDPLRLYSQPEFRCPVLVVAWTEDAGKLGPKTIDYLRHKLGCQRFCEIEPVEFFPMGGVAVEDDLVQFPESSFYGSCEADLVLFKSMPPASNWHQFLSLLFDFAEHDCHVKEIYTIGGMVAIGAHTTPRQLVAAFSSSEVKTALSKHDLVSAFDYETPAGQRPTLSSYLLWAAKRRNIPAVSLWAPIPFYLAGGEDLGAQKRVLQFIDQRLGLEIDFEDLEEETSIQNEKLAEARRSNPFIEESIAKLESNQGLSEEESLRLVEGVDDFLKGRNG